MTTQNKYRILVWLVIILAATNLSMGFSFLYHRQQDKKLAEVVQEQPYEMPAQQRTRFFREQLNLDPYQVEQFRELNREFNRTAWGIQHQLADLRLAMVDELSRTTPDTHKLDAISTQIGELHKQLKDETGRYYLGMKKASTDDQQEKLHEIFKSLLENNEEVRLPQRGRRLRNNRQPVQQP